MNGTVEREVTTLSAATGDGTHRRDGKRRGGGNKSKVKEREREREHFSRLVKGEKISTSVCISVFKAQYHSTSSRFFLCIWCFPCFLYVVMNERDNFGRKNLYRLVDLFFKVKRSKLVLINVSWVICNS